jgi:hypothetical protein
VGFVKQGQPVDGRPLGCSGMPEQRHRPVQRAKAKGMGFPCGDGLRSQS